MSNENQVQDLLRRVEALEIRARAAEDYMAICNLQAAYGYYVDKTLYDEAADLFARNARLEIAGRGLFVGQDRVRKYLHALPNGVRLRVQPHAAAAGHLDRGRWPLSAGTLAQLHPDRLAGT